MSYRDETPYDILTEKWNPVLKHEALPSIGNEWKTKVTAVLLENQEQNMRDQYLTEVSTGNDIGGVVSATAQGGIRGYDPILISLVRRAMPNLMAYDICGVQPMTAPTGLIFAMRAKYGDSATVGTNLNNEAQFQEPDPRFSGISGPSGGFVAQGGITGIGTNPT
jgi:hypothetical protein